MKYDFKNRQNKNCDGLRNLLLSADIVLMATGLELSVEVGHLTVEVSKLRDKMNVAYVQQVARLH